MLEVDLKVADSLNQLICTFDVDCSEAWTRSLQLPVLYLCALVEWYYLIQNQTEPVLACEVMPFGLSLDELLSSVSQSFPPKARAPIFH